MKVSIVTISYNQARFLERTIRSVLSQDHPDVEYIVVDPGSTDGSREIIERYRDKIHKIIFEPDRGAADGLNRGFTHATGEMLGFLNSDDVLLPGALTEAAGYLSAHPAIDIVSGNCLVIDENDRTLRVSHSDRFSLRGVAYWASALMQPSTFFRREIFERCGGFNVDNKIGWDAELWADFGLAGAGFARVKRTWSGYRIHQGSITGSTASNDAIKTQGRKLSQQIMGRPESALDRLLAPAFLVRKYANTPGAVWQRLLYGPVYRRRAERAYPIHKLRWAVSLLVIPLPWKLRRLALVHMLGYEIHAQARIGYSWVYPERLVMKAGARIGHLNVCKGMALLQLGEYSIIGNLNWISGFPFGTGSRHFADQESRRPELILGEHSALTNCHLIDCTNRVTIGRFTTMAGFRSQILTHSIDLERSHQSSAPVEIGEYCFVGTSCVLLRGSSLPNFSVLGAASLLNKAYSETHYLYAGAPARPVQPLADSLKYFQRSVGYVD